MALQLVHSETYQSFQGEYWRGTMEWWAAPEPLDFIWLAEQVVHQTITSNGGNLIRIEVYREPVWNLFGWTLLYHYVLVYEHHIVPVAIATAIIYAVIALLAVIAIYFGYQSLQLLFKGSPESYSPAEPGQCRSGYVWDQQKQLCIRVTPTTQDWLLPVTIAGTAIAGAAALIEVLRFLGKRDQL